MAAKHSFLDEDLSCCVCSEIFKDPVILKCSHSFCRACVEKYWEQKSCRECPICRRKCSIEDPPVNLVLQNIVESYLEKTKREKEAGEKVPSEARCSLHEEKLLLFCKDDEETLCVVCQTSRRHKNHELCPVEEAAVDLKEEIKASLDPLKEKLETFRETKDEYERTAEHIKTQAQQSERQIKLQFEELHQFLRDEEETRLAALREEEEQKSRTITAEMRKIEEQISSLSDTIRDVQQQLDEDEQTFLMNYSQSKSKVQLPVQEPELLSGLLIDVAKHLGSLKYKVWEKMQHIVTYTPVTLDPNTAHPKLSLSEDLSCVRFTGVTQQLPDNPERFYPCVFVLGSVGFTSGKHSWEVEVGDKTEWDIGVVKESINRKGEITCSPKNGYWVVFLRNGDEYVAWESLPKCLTLQRKPQKIRVNLDYDRGKVSFYNSTDMSHIYTFTHTFTGSIFPLFSPGVNTDGSNSGALQICPEKMSVTVTSPQSG